MNFPWSNSELIPNFIITLVLILAILGSLGFVLYKCVHRKVPFISFGIISFLIVLSYLLGLYIILYLSIALLTIVMSLNLFANLGDLRRFLANPFRVTQAKQDTSKVEKIYDRAFVNGEIEKAVMFLSKNKIGAIITLERSNSLSDIMKNGVAVHAPITAELLITIFYPGTRLHDGAVVVHGSEIVAASVFFTPTTQAFAGKYGSRHRAAIGISEISDALTIVVSEETGRISFAVNGTLESVEQANFLRVFENLLDDKTK